MGNRVLMEMKKRVGKGLVKGWQLVVKMGFLFHKLSMLYQCFINAVFRRNTRLSIYPRFNLENKEEKQ